MLMGTYLLVVGIFAAIPQLVFKRVKLAALMAALTVTAIYTIHWFEVINMRHLDCLFLASIGAIIVSSVIGVLTSRTQATGNASLFVALTGTMCVLPLMVLMQRSSGTREMVQKTGIETGLPAEIQLGIDWTEERGINSAAHVFDLDAALVEKGEMLFHHREEYVWCDIANVHTEVDEQSVVQVLATVTGLRVSQTPDVREVACWTPSTGEFRRFELSNLPSWVKSVYGPELANGRMRVWSMLDHGHSCKRDQSGVMAVGRSQGSDGQYYQYTETCKKEDSYSDLISGFLFLNERTGRIYFEEVVGLTSKVASTAITQAVARDGKWHSGQPTPLRIDGVGWCYATDILNYRGGVEGVAILRFKDGQIFGAGTADQALASATYEPLGVQTLAYKP
jgi:hypothetical protein